MITPLSVEKVIKTIKHCINIQVVHYEAHPKYGFRQHGGYGRYPKKGRYSNHKKA